MKSISDLFEQPLQFELPYTDTEYCYQRLAESPQLFQHFQESVVPLAVQGGQLTERLESIEEAREKALQEYDADRSSLRVYEPLLNCCIGDLYYALFDTLAKVVNASDLNFELKTEAMAALREALGQVLDWNITKRMEIGFQLVPE